MGGCGIPEWFNNEQKFSWRLSATRGDKYVIFDNTQTDSDGKLIVEQWKTYEQIKEPQEAFAAMTKEELESWLIYNNRKTHIDSDNTIHNLEINEVKTKEEFIKEIVDKKSIWDNTTEKDEKGIEKIVRRKRRANEFSKKILEDEIL